MRTSSLVLTLALVTLVPGMMACGSSDDGNGGGSTTGPEPPSGPFDLTLTGDASFQGAHGGDPIRVLLLDADGSVVASADGTVAGDEDPSFSFSFGDALEEGSDYAVEYWIDSNFGGGTAGVCDGTDVDHQWRLEVDDVSDDVTLADSHRPAETESVCDAFARDLSFSGDASFQGAHGGQAIHVSVVHEGIDEVVASTSGTVSGSEDPAFSFEFPGVLVRDVEYHLDYWIDSNFGGGTEGACDAPDVDHQWRFAFGPVTEDVSLDDTHRPAETEAVCSTDASDGDGGAGGDDPGY